MSKLKWNEEDQDVINFFQKFPLAKKADKEIASCDLDLLIFAIKYFKNRENQKSLASDYIDFRTRFAPVAKEMMDQVEIPYSFFKGYFHPWDGNSCLTRVRLGNPKDPMYPYSYEFPQTRNYDIYKAFETGAIPCPNCFSEELNELAENVTEIN